MGKYLTLRQILKKPKIDLEAKRVFNVYVIFTNGTVSKYANCTYLEASPYEIWFGNATEEWTFARHIILSYKTEDVV